MTLKTDVGWGQCHVCHADRDPVLNPKVEMDNYTNPINGQGQASFQRDFVNEWHSAYNSPHHVQIINGECVSTYTIANGNEFNCLAARQLDNYTEGIYHDIPSIVIYDSTDVYSVSLDLQRLPCSDLTGSATVNIKIARNLTPYPINGNPQSPPPMVNHELLQSVLIDDDEVNSICDSFSFISPTNGYGQLYIHTENILPGTQATYITVNNVELSCRSTALVGINEDVDNLDVYFEAEWTSIHQDIVTYNWNFGDNNSSTFATPTHTYSEEGYYNVCLSITNNNGCCAQFCKEIMVGCPSPVSHFTILENSCGSFSFTVNNIRVNTSYLWSVPNGTPSAGTGTTFFSEFEVNGTYTVTNTVENACGTASSSQQITVTCFNTCTNQNGCISIGTDVNSITRLSDLVSGTNPIIPNYILFSTHIVQNLCFSVNGKLILDLPPVMFINTQWFMEPGSEIDITHTSSLSSKWFMDSHLQGCDSMWRGIIVRQNEPSQFGNGGLSLLRTTIEDAWRAVELGDNTSFKAEYSNFFDNYNGIYTTPIVGRRSLVHVELYNNLFEDLGNMELPYSGQPQYSMRFHTGIAINGCQRFNIGNDEFTRNTFRNLLIGIHSLNTGIMNCYGNEFEDSYMNSSVRTRGVLIDGAGSFSFITKKNNFKNLNTGVEVVNSNGGVIIDNNSFTNNRPVASLFIEGINSFSNQMIRLSISNNSFSFSSGRCIAHNGSAGSIYINHNTPYLTGPAYFLFQTNTSVSSRILNNTTTFENGINYPGYVYYFGACQKVNVYNDQILKPETFTASRPTSGFSIFGCNKSLFRNNLIEIPSRAFNLFGNEDSQDIAYCCNTATNTVETETALQASFYLNRTKGISFLRQNDLHILRLLGEIREQKNAGNNWKVGSLAVLGNPTNNRITQNAFLVDDTHTATNPRPDNVDPSTIENLWFDGTGNEHPNCDETPLCNLPLNYFTPDDITVSSFWPDPDPMDSVIIVVDPARPHCSVVQDLYQRLLLVDSIADPLEYWYLVTSLERWRSWQGESWFQSCLGTIYEYNPDVDVWNDTEKDKDGIRNFDESIRDSINNLIDAIELLTEELNPYQLDSLLHLDSIAVVKYGELNDLQEQLDSLFEKVNTEVGDRVAALIPVIQSFPVPLPFLLDKKTAWIAELKVLAGGVAALDSADWVNLRTIAQKCPEQYGQCVFIAKSLMFLVGEQIEYDSSCYYVKTRSAGKQSNDLKIRVSPNPGNGIFYFQGTGTSIIKEISIFNISGLKVRETIISEGVSQTAIDLSEFVPGLYFYEVKTGDNHIVKGKIIKI
ncbi:MAG: PKD domain-containing protein [Saprospiraceae bacterium]